MLNLMLQIHHPNAEDTKYANQNSKYAWYQLTLFCCDAIVVENLRTFPAYILQVKKCGCVQKVTNIRFAKRHLTAKTCLENIIEIKAHTHIKVDVNLKKTKFPLHLYQSKILQSLIPVLSSRPFMQQTMHTHTHACHYYQPKTGGGRFF